MPSIYFIRSGKQGPIKIGHTRNIKKRMETMQTGNPYKLELIALIPMNDVPTAVKIEGWLHKRFKSQCIRGEWFHGSIKLKMAFKALESAKKYNLGQ